MPPRGVPGRKALKITDEDIEKVFKLHLQGIETAAIKARLGFSSNTIREIINVKRSSAGMEPVTPKKPYSGWAPPSFDLTKSRFYKPKEKGAGARE